MQRLHHNADIVREEHRPAKKAGFIKATAVTVLSAWLMSCGAANPRPCMLQHCLPDIYYSQYSDSVLGAYGSQKTQRVSINGHTASIMILFNQISLLESDSNQYRLPPIVEDGEYTERVIVRDVILRRGEPVPGSSGRVQVTVGPVLFGYNIQDAGANTGVVLFPPTVDNVPDRESSRPLQWAEGEYLVRPGMRAMRTREFADLFRAVTGQSLTRVKLLVDNHLSASNPCITIHVVGVDGAGQLTGRWQNGFLAFGMTFYPERNELLGGLGLLVLQQDLSNKK